MNTECSIAFIDVVLVACFCETQARVDSLERQLSDQTHKLNTEVEARARAEAQIVSLTAQLGTAKDRERDLRSKLDVRALAVFAR